MSSNRPFPFPQGPDTIAYSSNDQMETVHIYRDDGKVYLEVIAGAMGTVVQWPDAWPFPSDAEAMSAAFTEANRKLGQYEGAVRNAVEALGKVMKDAVQG